MKKIVTKIIRKKKVAKKVNEDLGDVEELDLRHYDEDEFPSLDDEDEDEDEDYEDFEDDEDSEDESEEEEVPVILPDNSLDDEEEDEEEKLHNKELEVDLVTILRNELEKKEYNRDYLLFKHRGEVCKGVPMAEINPSRFVFKVDNKFKTVNLSEIKVL